MFMEYNAIVALLATVRAFALSEGWTDLVIEGERDLNPALDVQDDWWDYDFHPDFAPKVTSVDVSFVRDGSVYYGEVFVSPEGVEFCDCVAVDNAYGDAVEDTYAW